MKKPFSIKNNCKLLVEQIINENYFDANLLLENLIKEIQKKRENDVYKRVILEESDESVEDLGDNMPEENEANDTDAENDEAGPKSEDVDLGEDLSEEEDNLTNQVGNGKMNEMTTIISNLNHKLNKAKINKLYNKISTLKSLLNALDLDKDEMEYLELDTKLAFYSEALESLQQQSMPGIDGVEQDEISEKIEIVNKALKDLENQMNNDSSDDEETTSDINEDADTDTDVEEETDEEETNEEDDGEIEENGDDIDEAEDVPEEEADADSKEAGDVEEAE